ncbi:GIY-YIG nuclease family protein [Candidatus Wolfebacteria bacterium]|nr:GIY-YIG nuclease family protein [Candidatus Wolfebacteria bacterium]
MNLLSKAKKFPLGTGVYLFLDKKGKAFYVGRASSLRGRVLSYFRPDAEPRLKEMVESADGIKYFKTDSVLEAVILEANLIKKYWPKYNIKEKDDRSFVYIAIPKNDYPKPLIIRGRELEKFPIGSAEIFGPYQSLSLAKNALNIIRKIFPYSACRPFSGKPCFYYQIGLCPGLCVGAVSKKDYLKNIRNIVLFLSGEKKNLLKKLAKENPEKAAALKHVQDVALIKNENEIGNWKLEIENLAKRIEGYDISHLSGKETVGSMVVFSGGEPDKSQYRLFKIKEAPANDDLRALEEMITRRFNHFEWPAPDFILIDGGKPQVDYISKILKEKAINIPLAGISKYGGTAHKMGEPRSDRSERDKLVFQKGVKKSSKELVESLKPILLKVREEAHRFAIGFSRRRRAKKFGKNF